MSVDRRALLGGALSLAASLSAAPGQRPNFLLLYPDQFRFDWLSGSREVPVRTPNLDALAARGIRFDKALVASPLCAPSRSCLASGKEYGQCGVANNGQDYPVRQTTYYRLLRDAGYHVGGCGKLDLSKGSHTLGLDGKQHMQEWGFSDMINNAGKGDAINHGAEHPNEPYLKFLFDRGLAQTHVDDMRKRLKMGYQATWPTPLPDDAYCDNYIGQRGLELMKRFPAGKPWHLVVNFAGPHDPEDITTNMEKTCRDRTFRQPNGSREYTPEIHNAIRQNYTAMVENLDRWVGVFVDELKKRGELDNTIVLFSSDHGEMLGDHNRWRKSLPYEASVGVPLVVAGPGIKAGVRSAALINHIDIGATFLDYAGCQKAEGMVSQSFRPLLEGKTKTHREYVRSGLGKWRMVYDGRYKLVRGFDPSGDAAGTLAQGTPEDAKNTAPLLFDVPADPFENRNLAAEAPEIVKRLDKLLPELTA